MSKVIINRFRDSIPEINIIVYTYVNSSVFVEKVSDDSYDKTLFFDTLYTHDRRGLVKNRKFGILALIRGL